MDRAKYECIGLRGSELDCCSYLSLLGRAAVERDLTQFYSGKECEGVLKIVTHSIQVADQAAQDKWGIHFNSRSMMLGWVCGGASVGSRMVSSAGRRKARLQRGQPQYSCQDSGGLARTGAQARAKRKKIAYLGRPMCHCETINTERGIISAAADIVGAEITPTISVRQS